MTTGIAALDRAIRSKAWVPAMTAIVAEAKRRARKAEPEHIEQPLYGAIDLVLKQLVAAKTDKADAALLLGIAQPQLEMQARIAITGIKWEPGRPGVYVPGTAASPAVLAGVATHAKPGDPLARAAFACLAILRGAEAPAACAAIVEAAPRKAREKLALEVLQAQAVFSPDPAWVDAIAPALRSPEAASPLWAMLYRFGSAEGVVRCFAHDCHGDIVSDLLKLATRTKLPGQGPLLAAAAALPRWKGTADGKRIAAVAKSLGTKPKPRGK